MIAQRMRQTCVTTRGGIAPLEFVMALPVLLLLMVGITWLGYSVIGQTEVLVKARNKAWSQRFDDKSKKPLYFPLLPMYNRNSDFVSERVSQRVDVSPMFSRLPGPEAGHTVLAGSWDHRAMNFKEPPDLKLMAVAAGIGLFGNALDAAASLDDPLGLISQIGEFTSAGRQTQQDSQTASADVGKGGSNSGGSGGGAGGGAGGPKEPQNPEEGEAEAKRQRQEKKDELRKRRDELGGQIIFTLQGGEQVIPAGGELKQADDEIDRLEGERFQKESAVKAEPDEEKKEQLQKELDRIDRQIELAKIKYKRLELEFLDVDKELKALD